MHSAFVCLFFGSSLIGPTRASSVVPGKFAVWCRRPVSLLKSVVLPVLGLPMRAMRGWFGFVVGVVGVGIGGC